jgi:hypothetical protein
MTNHAAQFDPKQEDSEFGTLNPKRKGKLNLRFLSFAAEFTEAAPNPQYIR